MNDRPPPPSLGVVPYVVAGCMFMENLDGTAIVTALPAMAASFGVDTTVLSLGISAYLVALAISLPLSGWLADRFGTRTVMAAAIVLFTLTSVLCGLCTDLAGFVAARIAQGASAALMSPTGRLVVLRDTPKAQLVHAIAILTWPALIAPILGPIVGGFLATYASWRWIFLLNVPIGIVGLVLTLRYVPQQRETRHTPFDMAGFLLIGGSLAALVFGFELVGGFGRAMIAGTLLFAAGAFLFVLAVRHCRRATHPLLDLAPVDVPTFAIANLSGGALTRTAISATPFLLPLMFQIGFGYSAFSAGALTLAYFAGNLGMKTVTTRVLRRFGFRTILIANGALVAGTAAACGGAVFGLPAPALAVLLVICGAARSMQFTALNTLAFADIPSAHAASANIVSGLSQQIAMAMGVAVAALLLQLSQAARGGSALLGTDFAVAFFVVALIGALALLSYGRLANDAGQEVSGHRPKALISE